MVTTAVETSAAASGKGLAGKLSRLLTGAESCSCWREKIQQ